jgi:hypothetical protein
VSPRRVLATAPAVLLVAIAAWETCATRADATSVPGDDAWDRASAIVRAQYKPGDLIEFAPDWVDPVGRLHLGDLISVDMASRMDAARYGRIWELAIRGAHARDALGLVPVFEADADGVAVRRYERAPAIVLADLSEHVEESRTDSTIRPTLTLGEVGFEPHRCVQLVPRAGVPLRLEFPQVALGSRLVGYVGLADVFTRRDVRTPIDFAVEIGGAVVASARPGVDDGWVRFEAPTTPGPADVTIIVRAGENGRLVCFAAEARQ